MEDTTDDDAPLFDNPLLAYLYVFWKQATPSPSEIAALHRIDPALRGKSLADAADRLKDEESWRLGPFVSEEQARAMEERLRSAGFVVEKKWQ